MLNRNTSKKSRNEKVDDASPFFNGSYQYGKETSGNIGGIIGDNPIEARRRSSGASASNTDILDDFGNEPPLLEELGINFHNIFEKTLHVVIPRKNLDEQILADGDLAGPIIFNLMLGFCLLLAGKVHFGYIYGFTVIGCFGLNLMLNLMSDIGIRLLDTVSIIGYCILPIVLLAAVNIVISVGGKIGFVISIAVVLWSSSIATRFIERLAQMHHQRYLISYPIALFYACFVLITVF